jgi:hypothetical protein
MIRSNKLRPLKNEFRERELPMINELKKGL